MVKFFRSFHAIFQHSCFFRILHTHLRRSGIQGRGVAVDLGEELAIFDFDTHGIATAFFLFVFYSFLPVYTHTAVLIHDVLFVYVFLNISRASLKMAAVIR